MTFLLDANLLVYGAMPAMPEHTTARRWLTDVFEDDDAFVGLAWASLYAFVRLVSNRRIMGDEAVDLSRAWSASEAYRGQPNAVMVDPGPTHAALATELVATPGLVPNDVADVHLAALAIERGLTLATHDHGFGRFRGLRWTDPLSVEP